MQRSPCHPSQSSTLAHTYSVNTLLPPPSGPKGQRLEETQACFSLLLKYILGAVPAYVTQHGPFGTESW